MSLETYSGACCELTAVRTLSIRHNLTMDNLATIKRSQKQAFTEREIWYFMKTVVGAMCYMSLNKVALGSMNLSMFGLGEGRFVRLEVLHLLPNNEHTRSRDLDNYYSPEMIKRLANEKSDEEFDFCKSEVFAFGLVLLELATCPLNKPKFHSPQLHELLWSQINKRVCKVEEERSAKLVEAIGMMLREDLRTRPNWNHLKVWLNRSEATIDVAPCIFWAS